MGRRKSFADLAGNGALDVTDAAPTRVPITSCVRRPDNPRPSTMDVSDLKASLKETGQLQPAAVASRSAYLVHRPDHADQIGNADWVVLAGNRRHKACEELAEVTDFEVLVVDDRVENVIEIGIIENIQREPLSPMREAFELKQLHDRYGNNRAVAARIGMTHAYVGQRLALLKLTPKLQAAVDDGSLKIADARELAKLPEAQQVAAHKAGPPYRQPERPKPAANGATGDVATDTRTDLDTPPPEIEPASGNGVSKTAPETVFEPADQATAASRRQPADAPESATVPDADLEAALAQGLPPQQIVEALRRHLTATDQALVAKLLQEDN